MPETSPLTLARAKRLRREMTDAERKLWGGLRANRLDGLKFYRQAPIGPYIVDFANHTYGVVIEVDGPSHGTDEVLAHDLGRDRFLKTRGYAVLRVSNIEVHRNVVVVLDGIYRFVMDRKGRAT